MHDPMTVVCDIRFGIPRREPWGEKRWRMPTIATLWHVDPEKDGSDDSCGWSFPKVGKQYDKIIDDMMEWEKEFPYFFARPQYMMNPAYPGLYTISPGDCVSLCLEVLRQVAWKIDGRRLDAGLIQLAFDLGSSQHDNLQHSFAATDPYEQRRAFYSVIRCYLRHKRKWYQHPRWHFWHWKLQIHAAQNLKRWLFSRCCKCGKGFSWGYAPCSGSWDGPGPRWFKGEQSVYHSNCAHAQGTVSGVDCQRPTSVER